jgi:arylsulfatase
LRQRNNDGVGTDKGGTVTPSVDSEKVGEGRVEATVPNVVSSDKTYDVDREFGSPVSPDYSPWDNAFTGEVNWVQIDLEGEDNDHLISDEERFQIAMTKQ